ncbi:MAG: tetratricopeptide repeat protein [Bacillota bacterium]|nr:tetratricopeptide repeat protein [Bacillota bacterium]
MNIEDKINGIIDKMKDEISFIEIKADTVININKKEMKLEKATSFPIFIDEVIDNLKKEDEFQGFKNKNIIEGMLFVLGVDPSFKYKNTYLSILKESGINAEAYLIKIINRDNIELDKKLVYANGLINIGELNEKKLFIYGNVLEMKGTELFEKKENKSAEAFMEKAVSYYNKALDKNPEFSLSYYKLGYYYRQNSHYLNAKAYWDKFLEYDDNDIRKQEIRDQLEELDYYLQFEEGYKLVLKGYVEKGLDKLIPLLDVFKNWWKLFFVIGVAFRQKQEFEIAKTYFKNVIELNSRQVEAINELAVCEISTGNYEDAKSYLDEGIKANPNSHELYTNRAAANIYLEDIENAEKDVEKAIEIYPDNEVALLLKDEIKKIKSKN